MLGRNTQDRSHHGAVKKGLSAEDSRRKREESNSQLRKNRREESLLKKRNTGAIEEPTISITNINSISALPQYVQGILGDIPDVQQDCTNQIRRLLSLEKNPPIQEVIAAGVIPRLVQFLTATDRPKLQFEAAWALTNVASGTSEQTQLVVHCGAVPLFIQLLQSTDEDIKDQVTWALGNIAGDGPLCRDFLLDNQVMEPLLRIFQTPIKQTTLRNATWTLSNLCRGKPKPNFLKVSSCLPVLAKLVHSEDVEVLIDALWALSYLSDGLDEHIQTVINADVVPRVIQLLLHSLPTVQTPALRISGNIVSGNDAQTQFMISHGFLQALGTLLNSPKKPIRKEAAWAVSNITAGSRLQCQDVIAAGLVPKLVELMTSGDFDVKKECTWAISNATTHKSAEIAKFLVSANCIPPMCQMLDCTDTKIISVVLEFLDHVLQAGDQMARKTGEENRYAMLIDDAEGVDKLETLQQHNNTEIYEKSVSILEKYFGAEEESENVTPTNFNFNTSVQMPTSGFVF